MTTVYRLAAEFDKEYPREKADRLAARAVRSLTDKERSEVLTSLLASEIEMIRRSHAREIEHRAWEEATAPARIAAEEARSAAEEELRKERREAEHERKERKERLERIETAKALLWANDPEAYRREYTVGGILNAFVEKVRGDERLRITAELLTVVFSVGDGRRVTWGEATLEDHRQRIDLLAKGIKGNVQTIRLHEYVAQLLRETSATCLNQSGAVTVS